MEQKKTLWIIAAVGAFLLVVLGAAGIFYSPAKNPAPEIGTTAPAQTQPNNVAGNNNSGWTNSATTPVPVPVTTPTSQKVEEMVVVSENTTVYGMEQQSPNETTIDLNALKSELAAQNTNVPIQPQNINITVTLPDGSQSTETSQATQPTQNAPVPITYTPETKQGPVTIKNNSVPAKETTASATQKTTGKQTETKSSKATSSSQTKKAKPAPKKVTQYWVQVASYSNKKGAENARTILNENKITSDIFTYEDSKGKLYFRVRVGPYMTKSEAEYWQSKIVKIPYFSDNDSYITSTTK